ncbi:RHS repeat-associated core domain-containing protein [Kitasatospora sp. NPDC048239]|uniref:RHS repeat-associated core domain-containing protein n=1 Tax=Kitasatospora sp. NPDC048239 TaxID=3364046 RepID=UPI0037154BFF
MPALGHDTSAKSGASGPPGAPGSDGRRARTRLSKVAGAAALSLSLLLALAHGQEPARAEAPKSERVDAAPDAAAASRAARRQHGRVEVADARAAAAQTFANPDGTFTTEISPQPRRTRQGDGWVAVDPTLHRSSDGRYLPKATSTAVELSGGGSGPLATLTVEGGQRLELFWPDTLPAPTADGAALTYPDVLPSGVDLVVTVTPAGGVQEVLVVKNAKAAADPGLAALKLVTRTSPGLTLAAEPGDGLTVKDAQGRAVFTSPPARMWDSAVSAAAGGQDAKAPQDTKAPKDAKAPQAQGGPAGAAAAPGAARSGSGGPGPGAREAAVATSVQDGTIGITPDAGLLTAADTVYPVFIDPSFATLGTVAYTEVKSQYPTAVFYNAPPSGSGLGVGYQGWTAPSGIQRTYFQLAVPAGLVGKRVLSADLTATETFASACLPNTVQAWSTGPISPATTWLNQPAQLQLVGSATLQGPCAANPGPVVGRIDATATTAQALSDGRSSLTFALRSSAEADRNAFTRFAADPKLSVTYEDAVQAPAAPLVSSAEYPADNQPHGGIGRSGTFALKPGGSEQIAKYSYQLDTDAAATEIAAAADGSAAVTLTPTSAGRRTLTVRAFDAAGHASTPAAHSFVVDAFASGDPHDLFYDAAGQLVGVSQPNGESARYEYDAAGNTVSTKRTSSAELTVLSTVPNQAPSGARVEISGTAFATDPAAVKVVFTGTATPAQVVTAERNRLTVVVPAGATDGPVTVTVGASTATGTERFRIGAARPAPALTGFSPAAGAPDTTVTLTGSGFDPDPSRNSVLFHRTLAKVTQATPTSLTVVVPGAVSSGRITVRTPGGTVTSGTDFIVPPTGTALGTLVDGGALTVDGAPVTSTIAAGKALGLRFEGKAGDRLGLGMSANTIGTPSKFRLYDPFGRSFAADQYDTPWPLEARTGRNVPLPALTTSGVYQLVIDPDGTGTGSLTTALTRNVTGTTSTTDQGFAFNLAAPGQFVELSFEGKKEGWYGLAFTEATAAVKYKYLTATLYEPGGAKFSTWRSFSLDNYLRLKTFAPGTYRLVIGFTDASVGGARLWLSEETDAGTITRDGAEKQLTLARPGQQVRLNFDGTEGQQLGLGYTALNLKIGSTTYLPGVSLTRPDGTQSNLSSSGEGADLPRLAATGRHELTVGGGAATGTVTLWLNSDAAAGTIAAGEDKTVAITRPSQNARLTFQGTAGQRLSVGTLPKGYTGTVALTVNGPDGKQIASRTSGGPDLPPLPTTGTYEIVASPNTSALGDYTLQLSETVDAGPLAVDGAARTVTVGRAGQNAVLRFDGTAGQRLSVAVTAVTTGYRYHNLRITKPDGSQLGSAGFVIANDSYTLPALPATGTYEITDDPDAGVTGTATYTLSTAFDGGQVAVGGAGAALTLSRPGQDGLLSFTGAVGDSLQITFSNTTFVGGGYQLTVVKPDGSTLVDRVTRYDQSPYKLSAPLAAAGAYRVLIDPRAAATGSATVGVDRVAAAAPVKAAAAPAAPAAEATEAATAQAGAPQQPAPSTGAAPEQCDTVAEAPAGTNRAVPVAGPAADPRSARKAPRPGEPSAGWAACGFPRQALGEAPKPADTVWKPDAENLAGKGWYTRYGAAPAPAYPADAPKGTTAVSGQIRTVSGTPLKNATVSVGKAVARTDDQGRFLVKGSDPGHRVLRVDGRTASSGDRSYGVFDIGVDVPAGQTLRVPGTVFIPQTDTASTVRIASPTTGPTVLKTPAIPGLEVRIPAGAVVRDGDGKLATELSITPIPIDRTPFPLPPTQVPIYFTVQPGSGYLFPDGAQIVYPNYTREAPGTRMIFWNYDPDGQGWHIYGKGTVTPDGNQVVPDADVKVYRFTGAMTAVPGHNPPPVAPKPGPRVGDPVDPATGLLVDENTDLLLDDVVPLALRRTYQQGDQDSRAFGVGMNFNFGYFPWSTGNIGYYRYLEVDLVQPDGSKIHFRRITPGEKTYEDALFLADPTPTEFSGATMGWNGNGWDVKLRNGTTYVLGDEAPLQAIRDKFGNTTTITRAPAPADSDGKVRLRGPITQVTSPNGKWIKFSYDTASPPRIVRAEDNLGRAVSYTYTADGHLETVTNPAGGVMKYTYESGRMKTITDARGTVFLTNTYDSAGRVLQQVAADGGVTRFDYTTGTDGKISETRMTDPRGGVQRFTFNAQGLATSRTTALGTPVEQTDRTEYDPTGGRPTATIDALGRRTELEYDTNGQLTRTTTLAGTPDARTERVERAGPFGEVTAVTDTYGKTSRTEYDPRGGLLSSTDALGHKTAYTTDDAGQITSETDPTGRRTGYTYEFGDPVAVTDPLGGVQRRLFDAAGRVYQVTDQRGNARTTGYDALDRIRTTADGLGRTTGYEYDPNGNRTKVTDPRGGTTGYEFDAMDHATAVTDPLGRTARQEYDRNGNPVKTTARSGLVTTVDHDQLDRPTTTRYGVSGTTDQGSTTIGYDTGSRVVRIDDTVNGATTATYDAFDRITQETTPQGTVGYAYGATSRTRQVLVGGQPLLEHLSDETGTLTSVRKNGTEAVALQHDDAGRITRSGAPGDGVHQDYQYDPAGRISSVTYRKGTTDLGTLTYTYDAAGLPIRVGGSYARTAIPGTTETSVYDAANQLKSTGARTVGYDADGNLTGDGTNTYTWNARGQLGAVNGPGTTASFGYDSQGRRTTRTVGGVTTGYLNDGDNPLQEKTGATVTTTVDAGTDRLQLRETGGTTTRYLTDPLGGVVALADDSGALTARYLYDPFGATAVSGDDKGNGRRYAGREDDGTGLYYNRARYYSPGLHRFLSEDPIGFKGGINLHAYADNRPTALTDPSGNKPASSGSFVKISEGAADHVMNGVITKKGEFAGWHLHPKQSGGIPEGRYISGKLVTQSDGSVKVVDGAVGAIVNGEKIEKVARAGHHFFPEDWTRADILAAGRELFANGTYKRGGTLVQGEYNGVKMTGFLEKQPDGSYTPSTFFPRGVKQ